NFPDVVPYIGQMLDCRLMDWMIGVINLDHGGQEGAAFEVWPAEPLGKYIEYGEQLLPWALPAVPALGLQPLMRPQLLATAQEVENQLVLGREITVQRHLRGTGAGYHRIDADRPHAVPAEQIIGGPAHPLAPGVLDVKRAFRGPALVIHCHKSSSPASSPQSIPSQLSSRHGALGPRLSGAVG